MLSRQTGGLYKNFNCEVSIFGHMHTGMILSAKGINYANEKLFLGVPSTSSLNIGNAVGYLLYIYPEDNSMEVSVLFSDDNLNIYEMERFVWAEKIIFIRENIKEDKYSIGNLIFNVKDNYV